VWGGRNVSASVREGTKWYSINVEHVTFFFIIIISSILGYLMAFILVLYWELCLHCNCILLVFIVCTI
jgi:hypothetical protein